MEGRLPYRGASRQGTYRGVDLAARTAEIERLAADGVYHFEIASRLKVSVSTVEQTMKLLRQRERLGSMRGPRAKVAKVDWDAATLIWFDMARPTGDAVIAIGCAERTIYRKLGPRTREIPKLPAPPQPPRPRAAPFVGLLTGRDPFRDVHEAALLNARKGRL